MKRSALLLLILLLAGCGGGGSDGYSNHFENVSNSYSLQAKNSVVTIPNVKDAHLQLDLGSTPKSLYMVTTSYFNGQNINISNITSSSRNRRVSFSTPLNALQHTSSLAARIASFNEKTYKLLRIKDSTAQNSQKSYTKSKRAANQGGSENFCVDMDKNYNCLRQIRATAVRVKQGIATTVGNKNLVIWLEDGTSIKSSALNHLSDIFLKSGGDNDIYDWESNIFGSEWGEDAHSTDSHLIGYDGTINILVYNMHASGMAGFFWPKDNFTKSYIAASNEKIIFYINATLLNSNEKETFTTLDHEFQHMIHFYQREVLKDIHDSTWFNEMMSEEVEDLLAVKIGYFGPRHVNPNDGSAGSRNNRGGRYPSFNANNTRALFNWSDTIADYGKVSSFGAYLNRNYNGAAVLHKMMASNKSDAKAIEEATGVSDIHKLINAWGTAVVLSDQTSTSDKLRYNIGTFFNSSYGSSGYPLGSINFFNYAPNPRFHNSATINDGANLYSKIGDNLSGVIKLDVNIPQGATITLIAK